MSSETDISKNQEEVATESMTQVTAGEQPSEEIVEASEAASVTPQAQPQAEGGRRTQLRIVRENIQSLSSDVTSLRKTHETTVKRLEGQVASLRKELAAHARSKELGDQLKSHEGSTKKVEKQVAALRNEMAALKGSLAKEAAKSRAKEEAALTRILAKLSPKPSKPKKRSKKR